MYRNTDFDPELTKRLNVLRDQPGRAPEAAARGRQAFLEEAQVLSDSFVVPVSDTPQQRLNGWMHGFQSILAPRRKEHSPMFSTIGTILLVVSLALGGGGISVAAAQSSRPDGPLYPIKTWSEDLRLSLTSSEQARLELALQLFNRRAEELQAMFQGGLTPPAAVQTRMQAHIDEALQIATGGPQQETIRHLRRIREQVNVQEQAFQQLGPQYDSAAQAALDQTRAMLHDRLQLCDDGLADPTQIQQHLQDRLHEQDGDQDQLQEQERLQDRTHQPDVFPSPDPQAGGYNVAGLEENESGSGHDGEPNHDLTVESTQGSNYSPGPQPTDPPQHNGDSSAGDGVGQQNGEHQEGDGEHNGGEGNHR